MSSLIEWPKEHPYETGGIVLGLLVLVYVYNHRGASSTSATTASSAGADYYSAQLQLDQLNAQQGAQQLAAQTQVQQTSIAASVANNQTSAQLAALQNQDAADIQAAQIQAGVSNNQTQAQVDVAGIQAGVVNAQTQAQVTENSDNLAAVLGLVSSQNAVQTTEINDQLYQQQTNDATAVALSGQQYDYATTVAGLQAGIESQQLTDQTSLASQIIPLAGKQQNSALDAVDQTGIFATILNPSAAGSAVNASSNADASGNNQTASIISSISGGASKALLGLFG